MNSLIRNAAALAWRAPIMDSAAVQYIFETEMRSKLLTGQFNAKVTAHTTSAFHAD